MTKILCFGILLISSSFTFALAGGVSGGGGNCLNPTAPSQANDPEQVEQMIEMVAPKIPSYFKDIENQLFRNEVTVEERQVLVKIFDGKRNIHSSIQSVKAHIEDDHSCLDSRGQGVDGSTLTGKTNTFCISAQRIAEKVTEKEIPSQSAALMVHEYSEIIGLTEEDAVILQKKALRDFEK